MTTEQQAQEALTEMHNIAMKGEPILDDDQRWDIVGNFITQAAEDKRIADAVRGADAAFVHDDNEIVHTDDCDPKHYGSVLIIPASVLEGE